VFIILIDKKCLIDNEYVKELNRTPVLHKIKEHTRNWIHHVNIMPLNRFLSIHTKRQEGPGKTIEETS
jgi:hypothetical protein